MGFDLKKLGAFFRSLNFMARDAATMTGRAVSEVFVAEKNAVAARLGKDGYEPIATGKLADPPVMSGQESFAKYTPIRGSLYIDGVSERDVAQGMIGDCYFLSALASVARSRPELITNAIKKNDDGTVTVTFKDPNGQAVPITVDADLPRINLPLVRDVTVYGGSSTPGELWPALVEKAYAQWKGSYEAIGKGGWPAGALQALTGLPSQSLWVSTTLPPGELGPKLKALVDAKAIITGSTKAEPGADRVPSIVPNHAYTLEGVEQRGGNWFVKLRNPWGMGEPAGNGKNDGSFEIPLADFQKAFTAVDWVQ